MKSKSCRPRIVLIDDDAHQAKFIIGGISLLDQGFQVDYLRTADAVHAKLKAGDFADVALFLVDVMMPPGRRYAKELTRDGEITGFFIARDIRDRLPHTPIILWSTDPLSTIAAEAKRFIAASISHCAFTRKEDAIRKVLLCYQGVVDQKLPLNPESAPASFERLQRWMKMLAPVASTALRAWLKSRGGEEAS